ncbi:MAG: hypothetical protein AAF074_26540 [Pseudomonadota bacterium]
MMNRSTPLLAAALVAGLAAPAFAAESAKTADKGTKADAQVSQQVQEEGGLFSVFGKIFDTSNRGLAGTQWRGNYRGGRVHGPSGGD